MKKQCCDAQIFGKKEHTMECIKGLPKIAFPKVKTRKISRKGLKNKADKLFSLKIRSRGSCELAGKDEIACNGNLQCAHIVGRANHYLRWNSYNALCLCQAHHLYYTHQPWEWQILIEKLFTGNFVYVNQHRNTIWDKDLQKVLEALEQSL